MDPLGINHFRSQGNFTMLRRRVMTAVLFLTAAVCLESAASAQITGPAPRSRTATLKQQLTNRLRATTDERKQFVNEVVRRVDAGDLDIRLVVAIERYSIRRYAKFPFPFFERAMRFEAGKRGVVLPSVRTFVTTRTPY